MARKTSIRDAVIIGAGGGQGAKDHRCAQGPTVLRASGILETLREADISAHWAQTLEGETRVGALDSVVGLCQALSGLTEKCVAKGDFFAVIGGDHSSAIGTWSGVANAMADPGALDSGALGMVWVDAHMDSHTFDTSPSGAIHGMPLAVLLGFGEARLTGLCGPAPALRPENVALIGARSYEPQEQALLERLGVRVFAMDEVGARGLPTVFAEAINIASGDIAAGDIAAGQTKRFGISIDLDAVDPKDAPGVGSAVPGGIRSRDLVQALDTCRERAGLVGLDIVEFNPDLDCEHKTLTLIGDLLLAVLPRGGAP